MTDLHPLFSLVGAPHLPPQNQQATSGSLAHSKASLSFIVPFVRHFPIDDAVNLLFI